jgi:hypothetical protein
LYNILYRIHTGALTYHDPDSVTIPNANAKLEFIQQSAQLLDIHDNIAQYVKQGIHYMLEFDDISELCKSFEEACTEERGNRDAIRGEVAFHECSLYTNCINILFKLFLTGFCYVNSLGTKCIVNTLLMRLIVLHHQ